ncbi:MAG: hypothetical protein K6A67_08655 [Bacteroidales bacterium]|nr:hypothetical protein [Bacteroidales bacterium]
MYRENEENLFGFDRRHKPPITILPTEEHGWGCSRGRLAYSSMNRSQEWNYSEYAITTMGMMPKNYIIVNVNEVHINNETAFKVCHNRVAIPVKEFAKQKRLSLKEQWELMNPQWIGTYFGHRGEDPFRSRRPTLEKAMSDAMEQGKLDDFMSQFWSANYGHEEAISRLERRARELDCRGDELHSRYVRALNHIKKVEADINKGQLERFHLEGMNAHEYLEQLKSNLFDIRRSRDKAYRKSKEIKEYINSITY